MEHTTPKEFMAAAPHTALLGGSSPWAARYAGEIRRIVVLAAAHAPRSTQVHLGPSELGAVCDRQVVGKLIREPSTNHVSDPWPSIVGTAVHAWLAAAFEADNRRSGTLRWLAEQRVSPHPDHPGTADLYDAQEQAVVDHKVLGPTSLSKIRSAEGPPVHYVVQLLLYARGYRLLGLPVRRVAIAAYPRTASTLDGLYVWDREYTPADDMIIEEVLDRTVIRKAVADEILAGRMNLGHVPITPDDSACYFCAQYRPQSAYDGGRGCPGTIGNRP
jgi:hypothetical protein